MNRNFGILVLLLAIGAGIYFWHIRSNTTSAPSAEATPPPPTPAEEQEAAVKKLSAFVDLHNDQVFAALSEKDERMPMQELHQIRANFVDLRAASAPNERQIYDNGIALCDKLLKAIEVREAHARRLADSAAKTPFSSETRPEAREADIQKKARFFNDAITRSWEDQSKPLRAQVAKLYASMRQLER